MKQQQTPPPPTTTTPSRSKAKESPKQESGNGNGNGNGVLLSAVKAARPRYVSTVTDVKDNSKARRSLVLNKPKSGEEIVGSQKGRVARRPGATKNEDEKKKEFQLLQEKLQLNENLIKDLQSQVLSLKADLDKAQSLNAELESHNRKLTQDFAAAQNKIATLNNHHHHQRDSVGEHQSPKFKDIQKLIANKLEYSKVKKEAINGATSFKPPPPPPLPAATPIYPMSKPTDAERKAPTCSSLPPPPPPPLPPRPQVRAATTQKAPTVVQFYHLLTKQERKRDPLGQGNHNKQVANSAHSSIVGEIQNRSAHLLAIKADIETKVEFINGLIEKVLAAAYTDVEDVVKFVDWLDNELSSLADERAVLKHFQWPERKADAMREAAIEYRDLKLLENEISSYKDDPSIPCGAALKKMASLLDKSERSIQRLIKLRNSVLRSYQDFKIPIDWMLDSGIVSKIKHASMKLAKMYMERVTMELELVRNSDRESTQEALLLQGVHFAYRAHQFAGGLDSETLCAFKEIRQRVPGHIGGSRELFVGIPSS